MTIKLKRFPSRLARFIIQARIFILILCFAVTAFFLWVLKDLTVQTKLGDFVPHQHAFLQVQKRLNETFGGLNQVTIAIRVKNGDILNPETLAKVHRLTNKLYLTDGINSGRVLSLSCRRIKFTKPTADGFSVMKMMKTPPRTPAEIAQLKYRIIHTPLVYGSRRSSYGPIVSKDFTSTLIQADFESDVSSRYIFQHLQQLIEEEKDPNHDIYISGRPILEGWFDYYLPSMLKVFLVTVLIMTILLYLAFRSKRGVLLPLISASISTVWGLGLLVLMGYHLNPGTILVPFLIMALAISHTVQFIKRYYERIARPRSSGYKAAQDTLQSLLVPASASLITDALGFLSLLIVPLTLIRSIALAAGSGVLSIFIITVTFVPAVLSYLPKPKKLEVEREEKTTLLNRIMGGIANIVTHKKGQWIVLTFFFLLAVFGMIGALKLSVGDNEPGSSLLYAESPYNRAEKYINHKFTGSNPYYIFVEGKESDALISSEVLKEMVSLQNYLVHHIPDAGYALSIADYVKGLNFTMFGFDPRRLKIPDNDKTIAEYLFLYTCSGFPQDLQPVVDENMQFANIKIDLKNHCARTIQTTIKSTQEWIKKYHRSKKVNFLYAGGEIGMTAAVNEIIARILPENILQVSLMVFICASIAFGSMAAGLSLLIPLAVSVLFTFGVLGWMGVTLTVETLPVAALGIGLGVDYGIYVISRLRGEFILRRHMPLAEAIYRSLKTSGKAVFFTGMTVAVGVYAWAFSPIRLQARLGLVLGSILLLNVIGSLILLPCLISLFKPKFIFRRRRW